MSCKVILKVVMVIISSAIFLFGVGTVITGVLVENNSEPADGIPDYKYILVEFLHLAKAAYLLIAIGSIITIIGFQGCCGAMCENKGMLMTFFISILIMVIVEVVAVAVLLSNSPAEKQVKKLCEAVVKSIEEDYKERYKERYKESSDESNMESYIERYIERYRERYIERYMESYPKGIFPPSLPSPNYPVECFNVVVEWVQCNSASIAGVAISTAAIEIAAMIVSMVLYKHLPGNLQVFSAAC